MERLRDYLLPDDFYRLQFELKNYEVDWDKAIQFVESLNLYRINKPSPYIRAVLVKEIRDNGRFIRSVEIDAVPNIYPLWVALKEKGVKVVQYDTLYINILVNTLVDVGISADDISKTLHYIVDLMKEGDDTKKFITIMKYTKIVKDNINFDVINERYEEGKEEWEEVLGLFKEIV